MTDQAQLDLVSRPAAARQALLLLVVIFVALAGVIAGTIFFSERANSFNAWVEHTQQVRQVNTRVLKLVLDAESGQRGYLLTGEPSYLANYDAALAAIPQDLERLTRLVSDNPAQVRRVGLLRQAVDERLSGLERNVQLTRQGRGVEAVWDIRRGTGRRYMERVRQVSEQIDGAEAVLLRERGAEVAANDRLTMALSIVGVMMVLAAGGGVIMVVLRYVRALQASRAEVDAVNRGLEQAVADRTEELSRANEEIQRFAYIVSHDLRAPLVNVMGYTSELEAAGKALARQVAVVKDRAPELADADAVVSVEQDIPEAIGFIRSSTVKMDGLINAILRLSREGRRRLAIERIDMRQLAQNAANALNHQVSEHGGEIVVEPLPPLTSDRLSIDQIFGNLLDNAVKFLDPSRPGRIVISGHDEGPWLTYSIADNGRGIAAKDSERVFELFRRAGAQDRPGEGLGLAFVRNSVRRLGGSIELRSELGHGSTFTMKFPKSPPPATVETA